MKLFIGDIVEIISDNYFGFPKGDKGKVVGELRSSYELEFNNFPQSLGMIDVSTNVKLISRQFQLNDRVFYTGNDIRFNSLVGNIVSCGMSDCVVSFDARLSVSVVQKIELEKIMAPSTQSQTPLHTYNGAGGIIGAAQQAIQTAQQYYSNSGGYSGTLIGIDHEYFKKETKEVGCQHEWRDYIGLSKRMDICTKCPASKNERGIYE